MAKNSKGSRRLPPTELTEDELLLEALGRLEEEFPTADLDPAAPEGSLLEEDTKKVSKGNAEEEVKKKKPIAPVKGLLEKSGVSSFPTAPSAAAVAEGLRKIDSAKSRAGRSRGGGSVAPAPSPGRSPLESAPAGGGLTRIVPTREMPPLEVNESAPGVVPLPKPLSEKVREPKPAILPEREKLPEPQIAPTGPLPKDSDKRENSGGGGGALLAFIAATGASLAASWYYLIPEYLNQNPPLRAGSDLRQVVSGADSDGEPTLVGLERGEVRDLREQLDILKARNRFTFLADRAIAEAERSAYFELRQMLGDQEYDRYRVSINTEISRIDRFYMDGTRLPNLPLPVDELFPVGDAESEAELTTVQLISLLNERNASWQHRARAGKLLGIVGTEKALEALALAAGTEAHLDALKEIIYAFEDSAGYRGAYLFDTESLFKWWVSESARRQEEASGKAPLPQ